MATITTTQTPSGRFIDLLHEKLCVQVEVDLSSVPLGSQFAVDYFFPDRKKLETGHR